MSCTGSNSLATTSAVTPVEAFRERAQLSRAELALRSGLSLRSIYYYEVDGRQPSLAAAILLAAVLGCRPADLRGDRQAS